MSAVSNALSRLARRRGKQGPKDIAAPRPDTDRDALHVLPLSMIPLETRALRETRLVKNSRLEGMIELFSDADSGSALVAPEKLNMVFDLSGRKMEDLKVIRSLSELPSYDVYSLRISLRNLGIEVDGHDCLRLSRDKARELNEYMRVFTRPLIANIYGDQKSAALDLSDVVSLIASPNVETARDNLRRLSQSLGIDVMQIPQFLEDYGDVYLSLAYYQFCLERCAPSLKTFLEAMSTLRRQPRFRSDRDFQRGCDFVEERLKLILGEVRDILDLFRARTADMWRDLSEEKFRNMKHNVLAHQTEIGGALCAITVKMNAWQAQFPFPTTGNDSNRADFILREMHQGLNGIKSLAGGLPPSAKPRDGEEYMEI